MPRYKITKTPKAGGKPEVEYQFKTLLQADSMRRILPDVYEDYHIQVDEVQNIYEKQTVKGALDSGREVELRGFSFRLTYGDMIEGDPDQYINEETLVRLENKFVGDYMPIVLRRPVLESENDDLPAFCVISEWVRYGKLPGEKTTELRVIWFTESIDNLLVHDMLQRSLQGLDWDRCAGVFDPSDL